MMLQESSSIERRVMRSRLLLRQVQILIPAVLLMGQSTTASLGAHKSVNAKGCVFGEIVKAQLKTKVKVPKPVTETEAFESQDFVVTSCLYETSTLGVDVAFFQGPNAYKLVTAKAKRDAKNEEDERPLKKTFRNFRGFTVGDAHIVVQLPNAVLSLDGGVVDSTDNVRLEQLLYVLANKSLGTSQPPCAALEKVVSKAIDEEVESSELLRSGSFSLHENGPGCGFSIRNHDDIQMHLLPVDAFQRSFQFAEAASKGFVEIQKSPVRIVRTRSIYFETALVDLGQDSVMRVQVFGLELATLDASVEIAKAIVPKLTK
jgi:hypothetical protein